MQEYPQRFYALDSWRGLCALWVVAYHFRVLGHISTSHFIRSGTIAVDFFFVLSGFVITHGFGTKLVDLTSRTQFMIRRLGRLYPLHIATLLLVVAIETAHWAAQNYLGRSIGRPAFTGDTALSALPANIFLVHGLGFIPHFTWNVPSWSISVEFALCFGFLLLSAFQRRYIVAALAATAGGIALVAVHAAFPHPAEAWTAVPRGVYGFFLGVLCYGLYHRFRDWKPTIWYELAAFPAIVLATSVSSVFTTLVFAYCVFIFAYEAGGVSRILKRSFLVRWGDLSYSIYLIHYPMVLVAFGAAIALGLGKQVGVFLDVRSPFLADGLTIAFLACVLIAATITYRWIEVPARFYVNGRSGDWAKRLAQRVSPKRPPPDVSAKI